MHFIFRLAPTARGSAFLGAHPYAGNCASLPRDLLEAALVVDRMQDGLVEAVRGLDLAERDDGLRIGVATYADKARTIRPP